MKSMLHILPLELIERAYNLHLSLCAHHDVFICFHCLEQRELKLHRVNSFRMGNAI